MKHALLTGLTLLSVSAPTAMAAEWRGTETPDYTLTTEIMPGVEVRQYPEMIMAAVTVEGPKDKASSQAFQILAGYIFGGNSGSQKIAMTSPVLSKPATMIQYSGEPVMYKQLPEASETWTQAFILPSEYEIGDLPSPKDGSIRVFTVAPYKVASLAFQGRGDREAFAEARQVLGAILQKQGIEHSPIPEYASYDAPWVPPSQRRHEVHFRLKD